MKKVTTLLLSLCAVTGSWASDGSPAEELITKIENGIKNEVIMLGHQDATLYGHTWKYEDGRSDVLEVVGDYPAVMGWELGGLELGDAESLDGVPFDLIRTEIQKQHARGGINTISWHAFNPMGGDSWNEHAGVVTSILEGGENYEMFQERLERVAEFLLSLKDKKGNLIPVIFRPWHEHDGNWFWWGDKWCTHEEYRQLWTMTHEYMAERGLNSLVWCYMPGYSDNYEKVPAVEQFDMVGVDAYQGKENVEGYRESMESKLATLSEYAKKYNKPITVSETGSESLPTPNWWTEVIYPLIENQPVSYVLFWRNAWDKPEHFYCAYKGHSSEDDFREFVATDKIITAKEVKKYTK